MHTVVLPLALAGDSLRRWQAGFAFCWFVLLLQGFDRADERWPGR